MNPIASDSTNSLISTSAPVFGDNVQDLLAAGLLNVNPTGIIVVNSSDDVANSNSGVTTLRDAINQANSDSGEDLIVFDRSLFSTAQTIKLNLGQLNITHNLDIIAPTDTLTGANLVDVSGNQASRVFQIGNGAIVNLYGLIVSNGNVTNENGGGILNSGSLTLESSIVRNDSVRNPSLENTSLNNGGGISNNGILKVSNSTISNNSADINGGGIYNNGGTVEISNTTISNNLTNGFSVANNNGGGIYNNGGTVNISNSTVSNNKTSQGATLSGSSGGGVYNNGGTLTLNTTTVANNFANAAVASGGGIFNVGGGSVILNNSTISGNSLNGARSGLGGGIFNSNSILRVSNSTINNNSAGGGDSFGGRLGGGVFNSGGILTVTDSTLSGNLATGNGGGIYNDNNATLTLLFSTLTQNQAANGGGIYQNDTPPSSSSSRGSNSLRNTIIAANLNTTGGVNPDVSGTFTSNGYNLIGDVTGSTGFGQATRDIIGTSEAPIDPRLASLDFNGGSTRTIALLPDSPAIGAADPIVLDTDPAIDQRGLPRRAADGRADIGAFEAS